MGSHSAVPLDRRNRETRSRSILGQHRRRHRGGRRPSARRRGRTHLRRRRDGAGKEGNRRRRGHRRRASRPTALGKRYTDAEGTVELLCTTPGTGALAVDGVPLSLKTAKPLPASD
ncbi:hypothetical protein NJ76_29595 [Rhodococcus sp. IITR03]|nr:hypothetical protein NJ76_29595 [Rhodococcus sp. IITR03]